jgi:hypothetical protein
MGFLRANGSINTVAQGQAARGDGCDRCHAGAAGALTNRDEHANEEALTNLSQDGWGGEGFLF